MRAVDSEKGFVLILCQRFICHSLVNARLIIDVVFVLADENRSAILLSGKLSLSNKCLV